MLDYWAVGVLGCWTIGLSEYWDVGLLGCRTIRLSDYLGCSRLATHTKKCNIIIAKRPI